jgi:hypothetical protein
VRSSSAVKMSVRPAHSHNISLTIHDITQLFNSMDPSPFIEKDLDEKAEAFIVGWAQEFPANTKIKLRVHLEQWPTEGDPKELIRQAVHNHFEHLAELNRLEFRALMKQGRTSLLIGLACLAISLVSSRMLPDGDTGTWAGVLRESLTIAGWVAMWRPMQIYLYDWWPLRRRGQLYTKLSSMPIEVVPKESRSDEPRSLSGGAAAA